jgi:hypothetical protein
MRTSVPSSAMARYPCSIAVDGWRSRSAGGSGTRNLRSISMRQRYPAIPARRAPRTTGMRPLSPVPSVPAARRRASPAVWPLAFRALGALATLAVGAVHLQQYLKLYSEVPTIGTLFVLNFAGATVLGLALLAPIDRIVGRLGVALVAVTGMGLAATSFAFLLISEHTPLFGFKEPGYDPTAIAAARISEIATVVLLGAFLVAETIQRRRSA